MNQYIVALIGLVVVLIVGFVVYGKIFKQVLTGNEVVPSSGRMIKSAIAMYFIALIFTALYNAVIFSSGFVGIAKGVTLGLMIGLMGFVLPLMIDGDYLRANSQVVRAVTINWLSAFIILGLVVGIVLK